MTAILGALLRALGARGILAALACAVAIPLAWASWRRRVKVGAELVAARHDVLRAKVERDQALVTGGVLEAAATLAILRFESVELDARAKVAEAEHVAASEKVRELSPEAAAMVDAWLARVAK